MFPLKLRPHHMTRSERKIIFARFDLNSKSAEPYYARIEIERIKKNLEQARFTSL